MSRLQEVVEKATGLRDPEDIMEEIMEALNDTVSPIPDPGNYYTFVYNAKTPKLRYDQHPLIACTDIQQWGFRGFNYHWGLMRKYTWNEVAGQVYQVQSNELRHARSLKYAKFLLNS